MHVSEPREPWNTQIYTKSISNPRGKHSLGTAGDHVLSRNLIKQREMHVLEPRGPQNEQNSIKTIGKPCEKHGLGTAGGHAFRGNPMQPL